MVGHHGVVAESGGQQVGDALGHPPGVDEDQRGAVRSHLGGDASDDVVELLPAGDRPQLLLGQLDGDVERTAVAGVDDRAAGPPRGVLAVRTGAHQQPGDGLDGALGGGETDPHRWLRAEGLQALQGQGQVGSALVPGHGVDLVDDDGAHLSEGGAAARCGHQQVEGLRGGDQEVGRAAGHRRPRRGRGVSGADLDPQRRCRHPQRGGHLGDLPQRHLEVLMDVDGQRLQRRDVDDLGDALHALPAGGGAVQLVDRGEEAGQGLARACGGGDQGRLAGRDVRPALGLRGGGTLREPRFEPCPHRGMEEAHRGKVAPAARWSAGTRKRHARHAEVSAEQA